MGLLLGATGHSYSLIKCSKALQQNNTHPRRRFASVQFTAAKSEEELASFIHAFPRQSQAFRTRSSTENRYRRVREALETVNEICFVATDSRLEGLPAWRPKWLQLPGDEQDQFRKMLGKQLPEIIGINRHSARLLKPMARAMEPVRAVEEGLEPETDGCRGRIRFSGTGTGHSSLSDSLLDGHRRGHSR